jgi:hypothetical protein
MENGMNCEMFREVEPESRVSDASEDLKRTETTMIEFVGGTKCRNISTKEPNEGAGLEFGRSEGVVLIVVLGHLILGVLELSLEFVPGSFEGFDAMFSSGILSRPRDC